MQDSKESPLNKKEKAPPGIILEARFFADPKVAALADEAGLAAITLLLHIWTCAIEYPDGYLPKRIAPYVGKNYGTTKEQVQKILDVAVELGLLYLDERGYTHHTLQKRIKDFAVKHANYMKSAKEREERFRQKRESNSDQNPTRILPELCEDSTTTPHTHTHYQDQDHNLNKNGQRPPDPLEQQLDEALLETEIGKLAALELSPVTEEVKNSGLYVTTGRRPLKKYPELAFTHAEFCGAIETVLNAGVAKSELREVFQLAASKVKTQRGKKPNYCADSLSYVQYALNDVLAVRKKSLDLKRSESYLAKASGEVRQ